MERFVNVTYCDDIRQEVGGKQSFMGIYRAKLFVSEMPTVLPKLCVIIQVTTPSTKPFKDLTLRVLKDDSPLVDAPIPMSSLLTEQSKAETLSGELENKVFSAIFPIQFSPFVIDAQMKLRIRVIADGEELRGQALSIEQNAAASSAMEQNALPA